LSAKRLGLVTTPGTNGERIKQAREIQEISQSELAEKVGVDQSFLSYVESGLREPSAELLQKIAIATGFPSSFFRRDAGPEFPLGSLLFRRRESLASSERDALRQTGRLAYEVFDEMAAKFKELPINIPRLQNAEPEEAARVTRTALGISPETPINHLINRLERNGVFVLLLPLTLQRADGFSVWADSEPRRPVIVLTGGWPGDRQRFSVAHELGHLVLHGAPNRAPSLLDDEADRFAAELLLPGEVLSNELKPPLTLTLLAELKSKWGTSIQVLARRAESLGVISEGQRKYTERKLVFKGWMRDEPVRIEPEKPRLFRKMAESLYGFPTRAETIASDFSCPAKLVEEILAAHASKEDVMQPRQQKKDVDVTESRPANGRVIQFKRA
jgi:Zn-dependent peptidase ImmA (M78 family)/DNA-binding XRE family transcriptional regulator